MSPELGLENIKGSARRSRRKGGFWASTNTRSEGSSNEVEAQAPVSSGQTRIFGDGHVARVTLTQGGQVEEGREIGERGGGAEVLDQQDRRRGGQRRGRPGKATSPLWEWEKGGLPLLALARIGGASVRWTGRSEVPERTKVQPFHIAEIFFMVGQRSPQQPNCG
ncbi:uncharacterized protein An16g03660 [Aspergillus niger]|uniref:Contig An16c0130, genomic contig n=2 Tax=Aspergillus niger TaxID=5061 RepID=A2R7I6_ASPNC|nr:uncharacterized protein An16g03660 [Aspergillus niger]CAK42864.1 unnamed protein product [Aspergillus niger]